MDMFSNSEQNQQRVESANRAVQVPTVSLPKGGGAIRGMGEKFAANPVTGTGSLSVPIATSPGRSGFGPELALSYDSGAGNSSFGFGWNLSLPTITRKTDKGLPQYRDAEESDTFLLSGAEDLVPEFAKNIDGEWILENGSHLIHNSPRTVAGVEYSVRRYRPRIEGLFARIERWTNLADARDVHWRSISKDNILTLYGKDHTSRISDPDDSRRIFSWLICETRDDKGNAIIYEYKPDDGAGVDTSQAHERNRGTVNDAKRQVNRYLKRIWYGNRTTALDNNGQRPIWLPDTTLNWLFEVVFDYGEHDLAVPTPDEAREWDFRVDSFSSYRSGFEIRNTRLCQRVLMFHHIPDSSASQPGYDGLVKSTDFTYSYEQDPKHARNPAYTFLRAVAQTGYQRANGGYLSRSLPPLEFEYSQPNVQDTVEEVDAASLENLPLGLDGSNYQWTDLHGEGIPGILTEQAEAWFYKRNLSPLNVETDPEAGQRIKAKFAPIERVATKPNLAIAEGAAQFMDLAGDGQPDLVVLDGPTPGLYEHDGKEGWQPFRPFTSRLNRDTRDPNLKFVDLDGDGHADILITENDALVWHASLAEAGFGPAQRVAQTLDEEKGPRLVFADSTQSIYLADLSGDGLTDLARIRNGEVCYWPNLGYGRFGAKVTMDHAPQFDHLEQFDHQRIRLADIDGSGTTDIIYLHRDGVRLYFNQSGNSWSQSQPLEAFPDLNDLVNIMPVDLLGNGTACLVWSSPLLGDAWQPLRYVNLMGEQKPHLLIRTSNNLGAETRIVYAPSTQFYLQDKKAGKPWITRLPFPVHVVERVETYDHIGRNRFISRYAYHHGYFDGEEREFRGFGMVEQWDTTEYAALAGGSVPAENIDAASQVPPVYTKTWFHTGVYLGRRHVSDFFAGLLDSNDTGEYYREPGLSDAEARALLLPDTVLPSGLSVAEERQACRALKGAMLRQEVYADDAGQAATREQMQRARTPYVVTEQNFTVCPLQPQADKRHAVFFVHAREAISYHYERNPADPRSQHTLTLEVDSFGNVLKQAAISYGRRAQILLADTLGNVRQVPNPGLAALHPNDRAKQITDLLSYTENRVTNTIEAPDAHRIPQPCEAITFELSGYPASGPAGRYQAVDFVEPDPGLAGRLHHKFTDQVAYENAATANPCRRPIEWLRTLYRRDDLSGLSSFGELQTLALPGESYQLAFTPGLLAQVFQRPRQGQPPESLLPDPTAVLGGQSASRGGYLRSQTLKADGRFPVSDADDHWWIPSGQSFFSTNPADSGATELAQARQHFFLPRRYRDPFGQDAVVDFDTHDLLIIETRDALDNRMTVEANDYRVLQPRLLSDANRNRTEIAFDALGMVVGTAVMGKAPPAAAQGDNLAGFVSELTQAQLDQFISGPRQPVVNPPNHPASEATPIVHNLLQGATTRIIYDLDRFRRLGEAPFAATIARETHVSALAQGQTSKIQLSFSYSDGFGREIQKKIQAEPGPLDVNKPLAPTVNPRWVGSGWTIFNNKGKPARQYEPFFSATHLFEFNAIHGVSSVLFYDPVERVVATLHPNHTYEKVLFSPWRQTTYDVNDTCSARNAQTGDPRTDLDIGGFVAEYFKTQAVNWQTWHAQRSGGALGTDERNAAQRAAAHADTPTTTHFDVLGRPFLSVAHNRVICSGHDLNGTEENLSTRIELDIEGNQRAVRDALQLAGDPLGRVVMRYDYDMLGNRIHQASMEAGERWMLNDVAGNPIRAWDSRGQNFTTVYDVLRRPVEQYVRGTTAHSDPRTLSRDLLVDKIEYGEAVANSETLNLRTRIYRHLDSAGIVSNARLDANGNLIEAYDFKGNLLGSTRQLVSNYTAIPDWLLNPPLDNERFGDRTHFDALNRPIQSIAPRNLGRSKFNVIQPVFNEANLLERIDVWLERASEPAGLLDPNSTAPSAVGVANIDYDAKGQRLRINYKNNASTEYTYDPLTFRLTQLLTRRDANTFPGDDPHPPIVGWQGKQVQNLHYTYDPVGNISHIQDDAQQAVYFRNQRVEPSNDYTYDALYRLIQASGREHLGQNGAAMNHSHDDAGRVGLAHPGDGHAMGTYIERYVYDAVGNFLALQHRGSNPAQAGWTRGYAYADTSQLEPGKTSNRMSQTTLNPNGANPVLEPYQHDAHGNMLRLPHLGGGLVGPNMHWDYQDQLHRVDLGGGGAAFYVYDASGERVRKVWEKSPGLTEERIYLGGFEIFRRHSGPIGANTATLERETLHLMDDQQRIATIETRTLDTAGNDPAPWQLVRYQFGNHLGSASLELDGQAQIISYEEYSPYGSSTYHAVRSQTETAKRYRYTGKERDEESGLYYHGARYYAAWLGRWVSCDPVELSDGMNLYLYVVSNPIRFYDETGFGPEEQSLGASMEKASKQHQDAANRRRAQKGLKPIEVKRQKGVGGKRETIPDEVKTTPRGTKKVVDTKARHVDSERNLTSSKRRADIEANLEQVKKQLGELEKAGEISPQTKGAALRVLHDSDRGISSSQALKEWREEAKQVRQQWIDAATDPAEKALRSRVHVTTTTRSAYSRATKNLRARKPGRGGGTVGKVISVAIAAYILFDTGDAWAAAQSANPVANTTDVLASGDIKIRAFAEGVAKDVWSFTPIATVEWVFMDLLGPRGILDSYLGRTAGWNQELADRAIKEGRNPFCAQCHGPGGALDPNNAWNQRAQFELFKGLNQVKSDAFDQFLRGY